MLLARPTKSRNLLIQMIGRGLRKNAGKEDCHVIDMVASLDRGIVTTPTLFGLDPHEILKDADAAKVKALKSRRDMEGEREALAATAVTARQSHAFSKKSVTFTHYDNVNSLIENTSGEHHIRAISYLAWVQVDNNRYVLSDRSGSFLTIKVEELNFQVIHTQKIRHKLEERGAPYRRPDTIATTSTFEDAVHAADTFAREKYAASSLLASAPWRRAPASPEQIAFLNKFREEGRKLGADSVTKGRAADWITKLKFGARGRLKRINTEKAKAERFKEKEEKWEETQRRAQVKVGLVES